MFSPDAFGLRGRCGRDRNPPPPQKNPVNRFGFLGSYSFFFVCECISWKEATRQGAVHFSEYFVIFTHYESHFTPKHRALNAERWQKVLVWALRHFRKGRCKNLVVPLQKVACGRARLYIWHKTLIKERWVVAWFQPIIPPTEKKLASSGSWRHFRELQLHRSPPLSTPLLV